MKRIFLLVALLAIALVSVSGLVASAQSNESLVMTEEHIARIRENCVDAQSNLFQLHANDAGLRVNRGQIYESMSTKLMAPFNSRIVFNRLDSTSLVSTANTYEGHLQEFRDRYKTYEETMSSVLSINCIKEPVAFYDRVAAARQQRLLTNESALKLHATIQQYGAEFEVFAKDFEADKQ